MSDDGNLQKLHNESINTTLGKLTQDRTEVVEVGLYSFRDLLKEVFDLRWQNRKLQARGTELLNDYRAMKRDRKRYGDLLAFLGRSIGEPVNRKAILTECPELFDDAEARMAELRRIHPQLFAQNVMEQAADEHLAEILDDIQAKDGNG